MPNWKFTKKMMGILLMLCGTMPLISGLVKYGNAKNFVSTSMPTEATVTEVVRQEGAKGAEAGIYYLKFRYYDNDGSVHEKLSNVGRYPARHEVGDSVSVRFHLDDPTDVRESSVSGLWLEAYYFLIPGIAMMLGGIGLLMRSRKANQPIGT